MIWRRENSWPYRDWNSDPSVVQPVASRYTDCAIPAPLNDYDTQDYWDFGLRWSFSILKTQKGRRFQRLDLMRGGRHLCWVRPLTEVSSNWSNRVDIPTTHLRTVSKMLCSFTFLECRTIDNVQKSSNSECHTTSWKSSGINLNECELLKNNTSTWTLLLSEGKWGVDSIRAWGTSPMKT
jgi:hypothetical protein